jgi:type IV pilus assembly protein PilO
MIQTLGKLSYAKAIGISILVGGLYYQLYYNDGSNIEVQIAQVREQAQAEEEKKKETDKIKAEEQAIKGEVGALADKFRQVTARFPVNLKSDEIIANLNTLAKTTNVRVVSVKKENVETRELYEELPLSIELTGTFNNLLLLMYNVATLERVTNFGDFQFSNANSNGYDGSLKLTTKVIGYKYKAPGPSSKVEISPSEGGQ